MTQSSRTLPYATIAAVIVFSFATAPFAGAQEATKTFIMHQASKPLAPISFADEQGQTRSLSDFKGKVVVLNIWATWCVPCRTEMPTLDRLQAALAGAGFEVVPVSIDRGGLDVVSKFFSEIGVSHLAKFIDTSGQVLRGVGAVGLPTTLIVDRAGNEVGRVVGPAEWDAPEVVELLKSVMARPKNSSERAAANASTDANHPDASGLFTRGIQWLKTLIK